MSNIYVIHENSAWLDTLRAAFRARGLPVKEWFVSEGHVDQSLTPPPGVFYNRMSASSFTRDHRYAPELTGVILSWLERHGRRVVNDSRALNLEINKMAQYASLEAHGIRTPRTVAAVGRRAIVDAAEGFAPGPVLYKPNRGGSGHEVRLFESTGDLRDFIASDGFDVPIDGIALLQEYVPPHDGFITRAEFIGGRFFYAVRVDSRDGFQLCPADHCDDRGDSAKFVITDSVDQALIRRYEHFLAANGIDIGAIEFVTDRSGHMYTYDVNTNTNYNTDAETKAGRFGMMAIASYLGEELSRLERTVA